MPKAHVALLKPSLTTHGGAHVTRPEQHILKASQPGRMYVDKPESASSTVLIRQENFTYKHQPQNTPPQEAPWEQVIRCEPYDALHNNSREPRKRSSVITIRPGTGLQGHTMSYIMHPVFYIL